MPSCAGSNPQSIRWLLCGRFFCTCSTNIQCKVMRTVYSTITNSFKLKVSTELYVAGHLAEYLWISSTDPIQFLSMIGCIARSLLDPVSAKPSHESADPSMRMRLILYSVKHPLDSNEISPLLTCTRLSTLEPATDPGGEVSLLVVTSALRRLSIIIGLDDHNVFYELEPGVMLRVVHNRKSLRHFHVFCSVQVWTVR